MKFGFVTRLSKLTDRYQTTVPDEVRRALHLEKRDKIRYVIEGERVTIERFDEQEDSALAPFLQLLERDLRQHPERILPIDGQLLEQIDDLVGGLDVDLDAPLPPDTE